jgi:hypothetical protein
MSRPSFDSRRFSACLITSALCLPLISWDIPAAHAQQSASLDLLPPVEVSPPRTTSRHCAVVLANAAGAASAQDLP